MLETQIVGQKRLIHEVSSIIDALNRGKNLNLLFTGRSGIGKTHFVTAMANDLGLQYFILYNNPKEFTFNKTRRFQVFDEAHGIVNPELLYPLMDSKKYTFILMTNFYGDLLEPFRNRCIQLALEPYSLSDIAEIIYRHVNIARDAAEYLSNFCKGSPRLAKNISKRMSMLKEGQIRKEDIDKLLKKIGINSNGLDQDDEIYLNALKTAGGQASLKLLCNLTKFDSGYITELESYLIEQGKIKITGRGRILC